MEVGKRKVGGRDENPAKEKMKVVSVDDSADFKFEF
jgi:hypothetical protein